MESLIAYLPAFACAAAMVVCFRMMGRGDRSTNHGVEQRQPSEMSPRDAELEGTATSIGGKTDGE